MINNNEIQNAIDFLTQSNYDYNRKANPSIAAEQWEKVYGERIAKLLEINFQNRLTIAQK
jgi:hypothetical protein